MKTVKILFIITFCILLANCSISETTKNTDNQISTSNDLHNIQNNTTVNTDNSKPKDTTNQNNNNQDKNDTSSNDKKSDIDIIISNMSLEEKVGQMFLARCPKTNAIMDVVNYKIGGYLLFKRDVKGQTKKSLKMTIANYQSNSSIPMFIGVDEEGGTVNRLSNYRDFRAVPFWSPQDLYNEGGFDLIKSDTEEKADLLLSLGINLNMAPVCDVSTNPKDFIYSRTFGKNADETSKYVELLVSTMTSKNIGCVLKHFPGYGNNVDTHTGIAYDKRPIESFEKSDLLPFIAGIKSGCDAILVSHNIVYCFDNDYPASLSKNVHNYIRNTLNFNGVIMTDDLYMDGIRKFIGEEQAAVTAIKAGNDILCCTDFQIQIPAVIKAIKNGEISIEQVDESVKRILTWKKNIGILN